MLSTIPVLNGLQNGFRKAEKLLGNAIEAMHIKTEPPVLQPEPKPPTEDGK